MWSSRKLLKFLNRRNISRSPHSFQLSSTTLSSADIQPYANEIIFDGVSSVPAIQVQNIFNDNKSRFQDGYTCFSIQCNNCNNEKRGTVYINKITGFCVCTECQEKGDWMNFREKIEIPEPSEASKTNTIPKKRLKKLDVIEEYNSKWNDMHKKFRPIASLSTSEIEEIISSFKLQTTSQLKILSDLDALYSDSQKILYFPLTNGKRRIYGIKELRKDGSESCEPFKKCPGYLRYVPSRVPKKSEEAILVYNIKDLIALSSVKHSYHVICVPHVHHALPQEILPLLEQYTKILLWSNIMSAARMFAEKLKEERCYLVRATDRPTTFVKNNKESEIIKVLKTAQSMVSKYITTFVNLKDEVFSGITNSDDSQGIKWARFPVLNEILRGHRRGELTVLTGPTGCGKTTFLSEYSLDLAMQGVSTLWGSFEIRNQRLVTTMLQQYIMKPLEGNVSEFDSWAAEFEKLPMYFLKFHGQQSIDLVMEVVEHAHYVHDIRHLVIDNLQFMLGLTSDEEKHMDRYYKQDKVVAAFRTFATQRDCHVTLIIHPRKERDSDELGISSLFGTAKASQEADNILIIQKKIIASERSKKYLQVVKNRYSGDLGIMPLNFNKSSRSFAVKMSKLKSS